MNLLLTARQNMALQQDVARKHYLGVVPAMLVHPVQQRGEPRPHRVIPQQRHVAAC